MEKMSYESLHQQLFDQYLDVYAVIDGAVLPELLAKLEEYEPLQACLLRGELPFDLAEAAPYLVKLEESNEFTEWLLNQAREKPCCIFARTSDDFIALRKHFRSLIRAEMPNGKVVHFRYYDPRVLATYLPTCTEEDNALLFSVAEVYLTVDLEQQRLLTFRDEPNKIMQEGIGDGIRNGIPKDTSNVNKGGSATKTVILPLEIKAEDVEPDLHEEKTTLIPLKSPEEDYDKIAEQINASRLKDSETPVTEEKTVMMRIKPKQ